jgi:hypothetical protein
MTLQSSGAIKLSEVQSKHGGSNPISMSEYYLGGGLVDTSKTVSSNASASSLVSKGSINGSSLSTSTWHQVGEGYFYGYTPKINPSGYGNISVAGNPSGSIFFCSMHRDNGGYGNYEVTFVISTTGTYGYNFTTHNNGGGNKTYPFAISGSTSGSLVSYSITHGGGNNSSTGSVNGFTQEEGTFNAVANETLTVTGSLVSSGHSVSTVFIGGNTNGGVGTNTISATTSINSGCPGSGTIAMSDFYGTE